MIAALREWLTALLAASVLLAAAQFLIPSGSLRRLGAVICGVLFLLLVLRGAAKLDLRGASFDLSAYETELRRQQERLEEEQETALRAIIESRTATYISDKARSLGLSLTVAVEAEKNSDGILLPARVILTGEYSGELSQWLRSEMGLPAERQVWNEA